MSGITGRKTPTTMAGAALLIASIAAAPAAAKDHKNKPDGSALPRFSIAFVAENDVFGRESLDRDYSNGLEMSLLTGERLTPEYARRLADLIATSDDYEVRAHAAIGQQIFTPDELGLTVPEVGDRNYAGLLYGSVGLLIAEEQGGETSNRHRFDQIQFLFGVVGPASQADSLQIWYHDVIKGIDPRGWDAQIDNRAAFEFSWRRTHLLPLNYRPDRLFGMQVAPHYGARLGNLTTSANIGATLRIGMNLPADLTPSLMQPNLPGAAFFRQKGSTNGFYVFAGVDGRYVAESLVLDAPSSLGNRVDKKNLVGDIQVGVAGYYKIKGVPATRISYTHVIRSREYLTQDREGSEFGSLQIAFNF